MQTLTAQLCTIVLSMLLLVGCANSQPVDDKEMPIGETPESVEITAVAMLRADQVIQVQVRFESVSGAVGDAFWIYPPSHEKYLEVLTHIGDPDVGEIVTVNEWPYSLLPDN